MTQVFNYFSLIIVCVLFNIYLTVSLSIEAEEENSTVTSKKNMAVSFNLGSLVPKSAIGTANPLPKHHMRKRAIDANQASSWLKFVWKERQFKIPQMFLTNIRNSWAADPAGGRHMFDADVPYGAVYLIKTLLLDSMFPRIGKNQ